MSHIERHADNLLIATKFNGQLCEEDIIIFKLANLQFKDTREEIECNEELRQY